MRNCSIALPHPGVWASLRSRAGVIVGVFADQGSPPCVCFVRTVRYGMLVCGVRFHGVPHHARDPYMRMGVIELWLQPVCGAQGPSALPWLRLCVRLCVRMKRCSEVRILRSRCCVSVRLYWCSGLRCAGLRLRCAASELAFDVRSGAVCERVRVPICTRTSTSAYTSSCALPCCSTVGL